MVSIDIARLIDDADENSNDGKLSRLYLSKIDNKGRQQFPLYIWTSRMAKYLPPASKNPQWSFYKEMASKFAVVLLPISYWM